MEEKFSRRECERLHQEISSEMRMYERRLADLTEATNGKLQRVHRRLDWVLYCVVATLLTVVGGFGQAIFAHLQK